MVAERAARGFCEKRAARFASHKPLAKPKELKGRRDAKLQNDITRHRYDRQCRAGQPLQPTRFARVLAPHAGPERPPYSSTPSSRMSIFMSSHVSFLAAGFRSRYAGW